MTFPDGLREYSSPVGSWRLETETRAMRQTLEKRMTREYLKHARPLYDWVVRPALADLERACPGVSRDMIRRVLNTQKGQSVDCIGRGPGALWQRRGN